MRVSLRSLLLGREHTDHRTIPVTFLAPVLFVATYMAYAFGVFAVSGGVVFIPGDAALLGIFAVALIGYERSGLVTAWLTAFASLLGFHAYFAFVGLSHRSFRVQLAFFLGHEGLLVYAAEGFVLAVPTYFLIVSARWGIELVRDGATAADVRR